jgi:hypothetical protein
MYVFGLGGFNFAIYNRKKSVQISKNAIFLTNHTTSSKLPNKKEW